MTDSWTRRMYLATVGGVGIGAFAGCNEQSSSEPSNGQNDSGAPSNQSPAPSANSTNETVVYTDHESTTVDGNQTAETEPDPIVFDGGDTAAFREALAELKSRPGATLEIEPGTYRLEPPYAYEYENPPREHVTIDSLDGNRINGNGATLVFTEPRLGGVRH